MFSLQDAETCLVSCLDLPLLCTEDKVFVCKLQLWFTSPTLDSFLQNTCYLENFLPSLPAALSSSTLQLQHNFKFFTEEVGCVWWVPFSFHFNASFQSWVPFEDGSGDKDRKTHVFNSLFLRTCWCIFTYKAA